MSPERINEVLDKLLAAVRRLGFQYRVLEYPESRVRRSIDVLVAGGGKKVFIKVVEDVGFVKREDVRELKQVSSVLGASPLLVGVRERGEELEDIVAYERMGVYAVSPEGFERAATSGIFVVKRRGRFYMRIDAERFREERLKRGLSLGDAADYLGVSRRAVYEYERASMDVDLDKALRILDVFGEDVFKPIDVFRVEEPRVTSSVGFDEEGEKRIAEVLARLGGVVAHAKRTAVDLAVRLGEQKTIIIYEHLRERANGVLRRGEEALRMSEVISADVLAVVERRETARDLEAMGLEVVRAEEAEDEVVRRLGEQEDNGCG